MRHFVPIQIFNGLKKRTNFWLHLFQRWSLLDTRILRFASERTLCTCRAAASWLPAASGTSIRYIIPLEKILNQINFWKVIKILLAFLKANIAYLRIFILSPVSQIMGHFSFCRPFLDTLYDAK